MTCRIVRSLWGGPSLQFAKITQDVLRAKLFRDQIVVAFDGLAEECLLHFGVPFIRYDGPPPPHQNISQWWKKLAAVRQAIGIAKGPVIHLDFDTVSLGHLPSLHISLGSGPPFAGRLRYYKRSQHTTRGAGNTHVYHGGCFYIRDIATADEAIAIHANICPTHTDEAALTALADRLVRSTDPLQHRSSGCDNPTLYATARNVMSAEPESPAFVEGKVVRPSRFLRQLRTILLASSAAERRRAARRPRSRSKDQLSQQMAALDDEAARQR